MSHSASVSVGHGPGTPHNEGTAQDRGTSVPDSNLTEIDATQEPANQARPTAGPENKQGDRLLSGTQGGPAQPGR